MECFRDVVDKAITEVGMPFGLVKASMFSVVQILQTKFFLSVLEKVADTDRNQINYYV